jgi:hypothetical protein
MSPEQRLAELGRMTARERFAYETSWPIEAIALARPDGTELSLLLKRYETTTRPAGPGWLRDSRREASVYEMLRARGIDAPKCFGAGDDWLLLERLAGVPLSEVGEIGSWMAAARFAAVVHGAYAAAPPAAATLLVRDEGFFKFWFDRALAHGVPVDGLRSALGKAIDRLARLPVTLIHGELYPLNLVVDHERVVAVDWEMAGLGPGVIDLASLLCGWPEQAQAEIAGAYGTVDARDLAAAQLVLALQWLGWDTAWNPPLEHRHDWLAEARRAAQLLDRDAGG